MKPLRFGWDPSRAKRETKSLTAVQKNQLIIFGPDQFVPRPVARTPPRRCAAPGGHRLGVLVIGRQRKEVWQDFELAKSAPVQIGAAGIERDLPVLLKA